MSFEIVIVGAGPNGILLAKALVEGGKNVLLIESGSYDLKEGLLSRDAYKFHSLSKMPTGVHTIGGGSTQWLGRVGQFIQSDFDKHAGRSERWPFKYTELDKQFRKIFGLITEDEKLDREFIETNDELSNLEKKLPSQLQLRIFRFSRLSAYSEILTQLSANDNFTLLNNCTCVEISRSNDLKYVLHLMGSNPKSQITKLIADNVVICGGTLQSTALMMRSKTLDIPGRENLMGRNLMEHFDGFVGSLSVKRGGSDFFNEIALELDRTFKSRDFGIAFSLSDIEIASSGMPNLHFEVTKFKKKFIFERHTYFLNTPDFVRSLLFIFERIIRKCGDPLMKLYDRALNQDRYTIWMKGEEFPHSDSNLKLSRAEEHNGIPKLIYNHKISLKTSNLVRAELKLMQRIIFEANLGKFNVYRHLLWRGKSFYLNPNWHPMGTLRMGTDKQTAICNSNLEVFNNPGLYVLSAAVFPTGSNQNPTAMVMALGQRLAEHILEAD